MNNLTKLRQLVHPKIVLVALALVLGMLGGIVVAQAQPSSDRAEAASEAAASAVLGAPLPQVRSSVAGLHRSALTIDGVSAPSRGVHQSYAIGPTNVVLLTVRRGELATTGETQLINGHSMVVASQQIYDGSTDMSFVWSDHGIGYVLHVNLSHGLTEPLAKEIAASVR